MKNVVAFADEFGNNSFEFDKQGTHFIVASVITTREKLSALEAAMEKIRERHFQKGEIKSQKVGPNNNRRIKILKEILEHDFTIYAVVVDKKRLSGEGFKYKQSFYKFLNGIVYKELFKTFPDLDLIVDEHGSNDFMRGFKNYVYQKHKPNLFDESILNFIRSPDNVLIQLADFIAGTLGRCFDETKKDEQSDVFLEMLKPKISGLNFFPPTSRVARFEPAIEDKNFNREIAELAINRARQFIEEKKIKSTDDIDQVNCIKLLLLYFTAFNSKQYITTKEILRHLQVGRIDKLNEHSFRTKIIAPIRDSGVLIASNSSGETGYKLPSSINDMSNYVKHGNNMILPMLLRIKKYRGTIKLATQNEIDILSKREFDELRKLVDSL